MPNAAGPTYSSMYYVQRHTAKPVYTVLPELAILSSLTYAQREENMQLKFASLLSFALLAIFASGTPVPEPDPASLADGAYMFRRSSTGSGPVITPLDLTTIGHGGLHVTTKNKPKARDISLAKRDSIACFQASVNGADKGTAVGVVAKILTSFPMVPANTGIGVVIGNSIAYVCNNAGAAQVANSADAYNTDNAINNECGSSTAGRYDFNSGIEFGRTANGKPFCDGS